MVERFKQLLVFLIFIWAMSLNDYRLPTNLMKVIF